jgi:hypothetical protein
MARQVVRKRSRRQNRPGRWYEHSSCSNQRVERPPWKIWRPRNFGSGARVAGASGVEHHAGGPAVAGRHGLGDIGAFDAEILEAGSV